MKRCKFCGVKMVAVEISGKNVIQCPVCGYTEEAEAQATEATQSA